ncbi:ABC transporter substrate-binding protein, partial [Streptomyces sp. SID11233]|nr:ABC transporter substrate-binding protein [Streptomyces sp. SID11233]
NGPYTINSYKRGSQMQLRKWDAYPGDDKARNDGVDLKVYTDVNTAYTDLTAGNLDIADDIPANQLRNVKN